jgi:small basic protein (TIGR04137 family)
MSIHPSLRGVDTLSGERSVLRRIERVRQLMRDGKLEEKASPYGLPKVRTKFKVVVAKKKEVPAGETAAEGEGTAEVVTAKGVKGAKGAEGKAKG